MRRESLIVHDRARFIAVDFAWILLFSTAKRLRAVSMKTIPDKGVTRSVESRGEDSSSGVAKVSGAIFARSGDIWTLGYWGTTFQFKDIRGLTYIQRLLQHPGKEFPAVALLTEPGAIATSETEHFEQDASSLPIGVFLRTGLPGDAGEMLDAKAKQEYKRRHRELSEELEDVRERGDHERAQAIKTEIEFLDRELVRAVGLRGRDRLAGFTAERARLNVTRAIKAALQKIAEHNAPLGELLDRSIRTGSLCSYVADPKLAVSGNFRWIGQAILCL